MEKVAPFRTPLRVAPFHDMRLDRLSLCRDKRHLISGPVRQETIEVSSEPMCVGNLVMRTCGHEKADFRMEHSDRRVRRVMVIEVNPRLRPHPICW